VKIEMQEDKLRL